MRPRSVTSISRLARRFALPVLVIGAVVLLAACGSDSGSSNAKTKDSTTTTKAASGSGGAGAAVVVKTASNPDLGTILVDADGKTLYTLTNNGTAVPCTGPCLTAWPPLLLPAGTTTATGSSDVTDLGTTAATGGEQVTQAGLPLYRFAADMAAGEAKGEGLNSFGGVWHVVKVGGASSSGGAGATGGSDSTTSTTSMSSGY